MQGELPPFHVVKVVWSKYVLFSELEDPQVNEKVQQTPNPEAHVPDAAPPLAVHSSVV